MALNAEFKFESDQWSNIIGKIRKKWEDIRGRKEFAGIVSAVAFGDIIKHFDNEENEDGSKWKEWSTAYKAHLKKIGRAGKKYLVLSGDLRKRFMPTNQKYRSNSSGVVI